MHLDSFFDGEAIDVHRLADVLDGMGHAGRVETVARWGKSIQSRLFEAVKGHKPLTLDDFVPASVDPLVEVIHHGKNTLPVFTRFQKRFCKPKSNGGDELWGYNEGHAESLIETKKFTGPGYYVMHAPDRTDATTGELDIDYRKLPAGKPEKWPAIVPNEGRLGRFVYAGMVDVMRGVSQHVSIGRAMKGGKWMDAWFVLVREDLPVT